MQRYQQNVDKGRRTKRSREMSSGKLPSGRNRIGNERGFINSVFVCHAEKGFVPSKQVKDKQIEILKNN